MILFSFLWLPCYLMAFFLLLTLNDFLTSFELWNTLIWSNTLKTKHKTCYLIGRGKKEWIGGYSFLRKPHPFHWRVPRNVEEARGCKSCPGLPSSRKITQVSWRRSTYAPAQSLPSTLHGSCSRVSGKEGVKEGPRAHGCDRCPGDK